MKSDNKMPGTNRDYPESDISDKQKKSGSIQEQQNHSDNRSGKKENGIYIKDMPEIKPAIADTGV